MPPPRDGVRGGRAMGPRSCHVPPNTALVQVPVGAEPMHPAAVLPKLESHVGVHHTAGMRSEPVGVATGRLRLWERACSMCGRLGPDSVSWLREAIRVFARWNFLGTVSD